MPHAALALCLLAGAFLASRFDPLDPFPTIAAWLLAQPVATFARNVHFWSALALFLLGLLLAARRPSPRTLLLVPGTAAAWLSGIALRGDADAREWQRLLGAASADPAIVYALHLAAAVPIVALLVFGLARSRLRAAVAITLAIGALSLFASPGLRDGVEPSPRGPWLASALVNFGWIASDPPPTARAAIAASTVRGRPEGCRACHADVGGFDRSHRPESIGCAACHRGDPFSLDRDRAHRDLVRVPGNLADVRQTCGQSGCHVAIAPRVARSIMATMAGVVAANRRALGDAAAAEALPHVDGLGHGVADSHLRELCASCHLGQPKTEWGAIGQESRGGGCNACHLVYSEQAATELARYLALEPSQRTDVPRTHPALTVNPGNEHCFGCHSRSSRIATSYEGWHELNHPPSDADPARLRKLDDGRTFERVVPDVHHERGLQCIDCHTSTEVMGSGVPVARKTDALRVGCADCHTRRLAAIDTERLDPGTRTLLTLRDLTATPQQRVGAAASGEPLVNVFVNEQGQGHLRRKHDGTALPLRAAAPVCTEDRGHARLSCASCHSAWASHCTTCHTAFDPNDVGYDHVDREWVRGTWNETSGPFEVAPPTLGVHTRRGADGAVRETIETFVPGMILTFDRNRDPAKPADVIFRRLYGLTFPHTVRREARSCKSCHADPVALGYGRGTLRYEVKGNAGRWRFEPERAPSPHDGLPADAWIGFLQTRSDMVATRDDVRPFTSDEQKRVLRAGACLSCHAGDSAVMRRALRDFESTLAVRSGRCALPAW